NIGTNTVRNITQDAYILDRCVDFSVGPHRVVGVARHPIRIRAGSGAISDGFEAVDCGSGLSATLIGTLRVGKVLLQDCGLTGSGIYNMPFAVEAPFGSIPATSTADPNPLIDIDGLALNYTSGDTAGANIARIFDASAHLRV